MLLGGVMAACRCRCTCWNGLRPEFLEKSSALLFIWTLYHVGVTGGLSIILAVRALLDRRGAITQRASSARLLRARSTLRRPCARSSGCR